RSLRRSWRGWRRSGAAGSCWPPTSGAFEFCPDHAADGVEIFGQQAGAAVRAAGRHLSTPRLVHRLGGAPNDHSACRLFGLMFAPSSSIFHAVEVAHQGHEAIECFDGLITVLALDPAVARRIDEALVLANL